MRHARSAWWLETASYAPIAWGNKPMRLGHARGLACAKTKKFPCIFPASPPPTPPPRSGKRNGKEIFGFASPFQSPKSAILFYHFWLLFLRPHGDRGAPVPALSGSSKLCAFDDGQ